MILDFGEILRLEHLPNFSLLMWNVLKYFLDIVIIVRFIVLTWCWLVNELALLRYEEIIGKYRCELRQQMSRSNNGLVSLFLRLSVW